MYIPELWQTPGFFFQKVSLYELIMQLGTSLYLSLLFRYIAMVMTPVPSPWAGGMCK